MISASHNPYQDNGLKVFGHSGFKLPDAEEHEIEQEILRLVESGVSPSPQKLAVEEDLDRQYLEFLLSTVHSPLEGLRVVADFWYGARYRLARRPWRSAPNRTGGTSTWTAAHCMLSY